MKRVEMSGKSKAEAEVIGDDKTLYLIDGHSQVFKAYHAIRQLSTSTGIPTNAVYGFLQILHKLLRTRDPRHIAVVFDSSGPTFRHEMYTEYKANRLAPPDDLSQQMNYIVQILEGLRIPILKRPGFEADDIIATLSKRASADGFDVMVVTADKDLFQLVDEQVKVLRLEPDSETVFDREGVKTKMGVYPEQIGDYLAIVGDSSDNVPGIRGVGPKGAVTLLEKYGSLEEVLAHCSEIKGKQGENVAAGCESARLSRELVKLDEAVALDDQETDFRRRSPNIPVLWPIYRELEFRRFFEEIQPLGDERETKYRTVTIAADLEEFCARARAAGLVAVDTETDTLDPLTCPLSGFSLAVTPNEAIYVPMGHTDAVGNRVEPQLKIADVRRILGPVLADPSIRKVFHNAKFDWKVLRQHGMDLDRVSFDTLIASYVLNPDRRAHGLKDLSSDLLGVKQTRIEDLIGTGKKQIPFCQVDVARASAYAAADADLTLQLYRLLDARFEEEGGIAAGNAIGAASSKSDIEPEHAGDEVQGPRGSDPIPADDDEQFDLFAVDPMTPSVSAAVSAIPTAGTSRNAALPKTETSRTSSEAQAAPAASEFKIPSSPRMREIYERIELPLIPVLMEMETAGVCIDPAIFRGLAGEMESRLAELRQKIYDCCGKEFNLGSPKQVAQIFFEDLKLKPTKTKKTQFSTDNQVLEELAELHEVPRLLMDYRQFEKLKSTYVDVLPTLVGNDGRIHTTFNQAIAATGRLSSSDPNLQNIPIRTAEGRKIRCGFVPCDKNHVFISADYSQIELRVLAHVSRDPLFVEAYRQNSDVHRMTASKIYRVPLDQVTDDQRGVGKTVNFATIYGISANALAVRLRIPIAEGRTFIQEYFNAYAGVRTWLDETLAAARTRGYVETVSGRRRYLPDINSRNFNARAAAERIAMNAPIQGTSADMIKMAMINIAARLKSDGFSTKMLLTVHDELIFEAPRTEVEQVKAMVKELMEAALPLEVPVHVDVNIGENWGDC